MAYEEHPRPVYDIGLHQEWIAARHGLKVEARKTWWAWFTGWFHMNN